MPMPSIFDITPDHIMNLDDECLRELIVRLCQAELTRRDLPISSVLHGGNQIAADGGIDVRVELPIGTDINGFIPKASTGFQAKADNMPRNKILAEMKKPAKDSATKAPSELRPVIHDLADQNGAYVIVSSKGSTSDSALIDRRKAMRDAIKDLTTPEKLHTDFYDRTRMADWVNKYPGVVLWVRDQLGQALTGWKPYGTWSYAATNRERTDYIFDETGRLQEQAHPENGNLPIFDGIARLRSILGTPGGIVRLTGLSGTGKTRLVEALFDPEIGKQSLSSSLAVYVDIGQEPPQPSLGQLAIRLTAEKKRAILVIDNCPRETHENIAWHCQSNESLSLITVDLDIQEETPEGTDVFRLQGSSNNVIKKIIEQRHPEIGFLFSKRIADLSDGNARIALLLSRPSTPRSNLAVLNDEHLMKRIFHQKKVDDESLLQAAESMALTYSFDGEGNREISLLAELIGINEEKFHRAIGKLKSRDIIQSRGRWRAILPQPLANWLAKRALENMDPLKVANSFWSCKNPRLLKSFMHRLSYLHDSREARIIAEEWLHPDGLLFQFWEKEESEFNSSNEMVRYIAAVHPELFLKVFDHFLKNGKIDKINYEFKHYCSLWISLLKKIAWNSDLFLQAVEILTYFINYNRENLGNIEDSLEFEQLFWLRISGTLANGSKRLKIMKKLLSSNQKSDQELGLIALSGMLKSRNFSREFDSHFGGHPIDEGWQPSDTGEIYDWYHSAIEICKKQALTDSPLQDKARTILADRLRDLCCVTEISHEIESILLEINAKLYWPQGWFAIKKIITSPTDRINESILEKLELLQNELVPRKTKEKIQAYVMQPFGKILDPLNFTNNPKRYDIESDSICKEIEKIGQQISQTDILTDKEWNEVFSSNAHQAFWLGIGFAETSRSLEEGWNKLKNHYRKSPQDGRNPELLGGFLSKGTQIDRITVERLLDEAVHDPDLVPVFPSLQIRVGIEGNAIQRLILSSKNKSSIPRKYWEMVIRNRMEEISSKDLNQLIQNIADLPDGIYTAADLLSRKISQEKENLKNIDQELVDCGWKLISIFPIENFSEANDLYTINEIARYCLSEKNRIDEIRILFHRIKKTIEKPDGWRYSLDSLIKILIELHPIIALDCWVEEEKNQIIFFKQINPLNDTNHDYLSKIPSDIVIRWASANPKLRFPALANNIIPFKVKNGASILTETMSSIIDNAPNRPEIFKILETKIFPGSWSGSLITILEERRSIIEDFTSDNDPDVVTIANAIIDKIQERIYFEKSRDRNRDERFE